MDPIVTAAIIAAGSSAVAAPLLTIVGKEFFRRRRILKKTKPLPDVQIKETKDCADPDLWDGIKLLERRLESSELDAGRDMVRWVKEAQERKHRNLEHFLVAKLRGNQKVCGFFYGEYSKTKRFYYVSYLVIEESIPEAVNKISIELMKYLTRKILNRIKPCRGAFFEVSYPGEAESKARLRLFSLMSEGLDWELRRIGIDYIQPGLYKDSDDIGKEIPAALMYAKPRFTKRRSRSVPSKQEISHADTVGILEFIYKDVYWDLFINDIPFEREYRNELCALFERVKKDLPGRIPLLR